MNDIDKVDTMGKPDYSFKNLFEELLRRPQGLVDDTRCEGTKVIMRLSAVAVLSMLIFGFLLGTFSYGHQLWAAPVKLVCGLIFAGLICFPSLYIFGSLAGSQASLMRMASYLCAALALAGILLLGFAPAVWIFAQGTSSVGFIGSLAVIVWMIALAFGYRFLRLGLKATGAKLRIPIVIWAGIFLLVTLQLSTTLRPILGTAEHQLTSEKKFFLTHWAQSAFAPPYSEQTDEPTQQPERGEQVNPYE